MYRLSITALTLPGVAIGMFVIETDSLRNSLPSVSVIVEYIVSS